MYAFIKRAPFDDKTLCYSYIGQPTYKFVFIADVDLIIYFIV